MKKTLIAIIEKSCQLNNDDRKTFDEIVHKTPLKEEYEEGGNSRKRRKYKRTKNTKRVCSNKLRYCV